MSQIIGITGIIASGKSIAAKYLAEKYGYVLINVDEVGHQLLEKDSALYAKIIKEFSTANRKRLAEIVFKNQDKLEKLNKLMHPVMFKLIKKQIEDLKKQNKKIVIDAALLFQIGLDSFCDKILCISSTNELIHERLLKKGLTLKQINERLANVPAIPEESVLILENNSSPEEMLKKLNALIG